jgi:uncharacterized protein (DUF58 family)
MNTQELLKKVRRIEIKTRRLSNHLFSGEYHSSFKGRGMAFSEVRKYAYGDDIRAIDWNVTARLNEPYIKVFEEERELTLMLMVDASGSGFFGSRVQQKREMITEICATLAFSAIQNNDKVGLILFTDEIELFIPPGKGKTHTLRIIRELIEFKPKHRSTDIGKALKYLAGIQKKKAIAFILSDFMDSEYKDPLKILSQRHDVTGIRIFDPRERDLPNLGIVPMHDLESGSVKWVNTGSKALREEQRRHFSRQESYFNQSFRKSGAGHLSVRIDESYPKKLLGYFREKSAR